MSEYAFRFVTFLSDYGMADEFVGICHGVILRIAPHLRIIDISHGIKPQSVREGAMVLAQAIPYMPPGIHLAIVDPGVGSARRPVMIALPDGSWLIGPDNGLLVPAATKLGGIVSCRTIDNGNLMLPNPSKTFHGRDIFAPAAAHLAAGVLPEEFGPEVPAASLVPLQVPAPRRHGDHLHALVLHVDRFGNLQTNVTPEELDGIGVSAGSLVEVRLEGHRSLVPFGETFASVPAGEPVITADSFGLMAVAVNRGSAADRYRASAGSSVILGPPGSGSAG